MSGEIILDSVLGGILLFAPALGMVRGFTRELVSLLAMAGGFVMACHLHAKFAPAVAPFFRATDPAALTAFLGVLLVAMIAGALLSRWAGKQADKTGYRRLDRVLGVGMGLVRAFLACLIVVVTLATFSVGTGPLARSEVVRYLVPGARLIVYAAPAEMRARFHNGFEQAQKMRPKKGRSGKNVRPASGTRPESSQ